jgi:hypothetical protein
MFWRSETLVHVFGIVLDVNLRVIMEYFPQGPLDQYLREHDLPIIDLVEAATNLAKALFYLVLILKCCNFHEKNTTIFFFNDRKKKVSFTVKSVAEI